MATKKTEKNPEIDIESTFNELTEKEVKAAENKERTPGRIIIKRFPVRKARITLVGDSPLLVHAWSEKAKKAMLDAQRDPDPKKGKGKGKKHDIREPFADYVNAAYWLTEKPDVDGKPDEEQERLFMEAWKNGAKFGFPVIAFPILQNCICFVHIARSFLFHSSHFYLLLLHTILRLSLR